MRPAIAVLAAICVFGPAWAASADTLPLDVVVPEATVPQTKAAASLDEALGRFREGKIDDCLRLLRSAAWLQPELPPGRLMLARLFLGANRIPEARANLEQTAAEHPDDPGTYLSFGQLALAEGRLTDALLHFDKAQTLAASKSVGEQARRYVQIQGSAGRAAVAERRQDWETARLALEAWLKLEPKNGKARQRLGRALFHLDRQGEAHEQFTQAVKDDDTLEPAAISMGWLYHRSGDAEKAAEWMERAVESAPDDAAARFSYATWLLEQDRPEEARPHAEAAEKLDPESRPAKILRGQIARALKQYAEAEQIFQSLHQAAPADFVAGNLLARALADQDGEASRRRALELATVNLRQYPKSPEAVSTLGWANYRFGNLDEAERALQAAASSGQVSSETAYYLARLLAERGRTEEVKALLKSAVESPGIFVYRTAAAQRIKEVAEEKQTENVQSQ